MSHLYMYHMKEAPRVEDTHVASGAFCQCSGGGGWVTGSRSTHRAALLVGLWLKGWAYLLHLKGVSSAWITGADRSEPQRSFGTPSTVSSPHCVFSMGFSSREMPQILALLTVV